MYAKTERLQRFTGQLYRKVGKLNLYICFCCEKNKPDKVRLKEELRQIKRLISEIETQIDEP